MELNFKKIDLRNNERLSVQVANAIEEKIRANKIPMGEKLPPEKQLCKVFNVCLKTMREALSRLEEKGYILRRPSYGTTVCDSNPLLKKS